MKNNKNIKTSTLIMNNTSLWHSPRKYIMNKVSQGLDGIVNKINEDDLKSIKEQERYGHLSPETSQNMIMLEAEITTKMLSLNAVSLSENVLDMF